MSFEPESVKRLRAVLRPLGAVAGVTGAAAIVNRRLRASTGIPVNRLGGTQRAWKWRDHDVFVTEAGTGSPILLVHGVSVGASSFEYRKLFVLLAKTHRVFAFDLLGCGLSTMPDVEYTGDLFVQQAADALSAFSEEPLTVVGSSLGAAFAAGAAARAGSRVARLVAICPAGGAAPSAERAALRHAAGALMRLPLAGESFYNAIASNASIRRFLERRIYADPRRVTADVVAHYYAVAHQPGARRVTAAFLGGALDGDLARDLPFVEAPVLVIWGDRASSLNPASNAPETVRLAKRGSAVTVDDAGLLPHEEQPEAVAAAISAFEGSHGGGTNGARYADRPRPYDLQEL